MENSHGLPRLTELLVEIKNDIAVLTINRPQSMNALTITTKSELKAFFEYANQTDEFHVVILTGAGDRAFCAGTDLYTMANFGCIEAEQMLWLEHRMNDAIRHCNKPVIAAVNGTALGGGCLIPLICDFSVVSESAILGFPEIRSGLPASIEISIIHKFVGLAKAREMVFFGESFTPKEALEAGLINSVVPKEQVMLHAQEIARKFLKQSPTALRMQKELVNKWIESDFVSSVETSIYAAGLAFSTGEPRNAIQKFIDRKKPTE